MSAIQAAMSPAEPQPVRREPLLAPGSRGLTWVLALVCMFGAGSIVGGLDALGSIGSLGVLMLRTLAIEQWMDWKFAQALLLHAAILALAVQAIRASRGTSIRRPLWGIAVAEATILAVVLLSRVVGGDMSWVRTVFVMSSGAQWVCVLWIAAKLSDGRTGSVWVAGFGALPGHFLWLGTDSPEMYAAFGVASIVAGIALLRALTPPRQAAATALPELPWKHVSRGLSLMMWVMLARIPFAIAASFTSFDNYVPDSGASTALVVVIGGANLTLYAFHLRSLWLCAKAPVASGARMGFGAAVVLASVAIYIEVSALAIVLQHGGAVGHLFSMTPFFVTLGSLCMTWLALYRLIDHLEPGQAGKKIWRVFAPTVPAIAMLVLSGFLTLKATFSFFGATSVWDMVASTILVMLPAAGILMLWSFGRMVGLLSTTSDLIEARRLGLPTAHLGEWKP